MNLADKLEELMLQACAIIVIGAWLFVLYALIVG
jgi:hypothetical protein